MARRRGVLAEIQRERKARQRERDRQQRLAIQAGLRAQKAHEKAEREAGKRAAADETARRRLEIEERKAEAAALTAEIDDTLTQLDGILSASLSNRPVLSFQVLRNDVPLRPFDPAGLARPQPPPRWEDYMPDPPSLAQRLVGSAKYRQKELASRRAYEDACTQHAAEDAARKREFADRRSAYNRYVTETTTRHVAGVDTWEQDFRAGDAEAVARFFTMVLEGSPYPDGFPERSPVVGYDPAAQHLMVDCELPHQEIIPKERGYRYVQTRQETDVLARPVREIKDRYRQLICQVALRVVHEAFTADTAGVVDIVAFNGRLSTVDRATGKPDRPYLISLRVGRDEFSSLVLAQVDPVACVARLGARVSPHPYDLEAVSPVVDTEAFLAQFNFVEGADVIAGLDSRPDLLDLSPWDFETFVKELFIKMGLKSWKTQDVHDDGVDAVAVNEDPVFGGMCVIQAKRYTKPVPPAAIRELMGSMADKHATKGILVTTSWVGPRGLAQAERDGRIDIIDGRNLKQLCRDVGLDILISLPKTPRHWQQP